MPEFFTPAGYAGGKLVLSRRRVLDALQRHLLIAIRPGNPTDTSG
jgi:hypothetical protein